MTSGIAAVFWIFQHSISQNPVFVLSTFNVVHKNTTSPVNLLLYHRKEGAQVIESQGRMNENLAIDIAERELAATANTSRSAKNTSRVSTVTLSHAASGARIPKPEAKVHRGDNNSDHQHIAHFLAVIEALDQLGPVRSSPASSQYFGAPANRLAGENRAHRAAASIPGRGVPAQSAHPAAHALADKIKQTAHLASTQVPHVQGVQDENHATHPRPVAAAHPVPAQLAAGAALRPPAADRPTALRDFIRVIEELEASRPPPMAVSVVGHANRHAWDDG
jgi:hypothetical protein